MFAAGLPIRREAESCAEFQSVSVNLLRLHTLTRALQRHVARRQDQTFADWFAELRELAGERWADVADQAPTVYAVWGGGATPARALYMVGLILPPKTAAA